MSEDNYDSDYEFARQTHYDLIRKGTDALDDMLEVARESEHPRAYEVYSKLLKDISDINNGLMDLNKKQKELTKEEEAAKKVTNNNLFIGSTTDLQRLLLGKPLEKDVTPEVVDSNE